jgi:hypothetical protein
VGVELSAMVLMQGMSVTDLAQHVLSKMLPDEVTPAPQIQSDTELGEIVDGMSEAELDALLASGSV